MYFCNTFMICLIDSGATFLYLNTNIREIYNTNWSNRSLYWNIIFHHSVELRFHKTQGITWLNINFWTRQLGDWMIWHWRDLCKIIFKYILCMFVHVCVCVLGHLYVGMNWFSFFFIWVTGWLSHNVRGQGLRIGHIEHMCLFACVYQVHIFQFVLYWLCNHCALVLLGPQKKIKLNLLLYIFFLSTIGTDAFASSKEASLNEIHPKRTCYQKLCHKLTAPKCDSQRERGQARERE